jgi:hypothetical protein
VYINKFTFIIQGFRPSCGGTGPKASEMERIDERLKLKANGRSVKFYGLIESILLPETRMKSV